MRSYFGSQTWLRNHRRLEKVFAMSFGTKSSGIDIMRIDSNHFCNHNLIKEIVFKVVLLFPKKARILNIRFYLLSKHFLFEEFERLDPRFRLLKLSPIFFI
jgi:hypothetical protein